MKMMEVKSHPEWWISLPEHEIKTFYSRGRFAGWRDEVYEIVPRNDGTAVVEYPQPEWGSASKATLHATVRIKTGFVNGRPIGPVDRVLMNAQKVYGKTYTIQEYLRKYGFKWDANEKAWIKR